MEEKKKKKQEEKKKKEGAQKKVCSYSCCNWPLLNVSVGTDAAASLVAEWAWHKWWLSLAWERLCPQNPCPSAVPGLCTAHAHRAPHLPPVAIPQPQGPAAVPAGAGGSFSLLCILFLPFLV